MESQNSECNIITSTKLFLSDCLYIYIYIIRADDEVLLEIRTAF